jgi:hypothetical protein
VLLLLLWLLPRWQAAHSNGLEIARKVVES